MLRRWVLARAQLIRRRDQTTQIWGREIHFFSNNYKDIDKMSTATLSSLFPKGKYAYVGGHVKQLLSRGNDGSIFSDAPSATAEELKAAHAERYTQHVFDGTLTKQEMQKIGFVWSDALVRRVTGSAGATIAAMRYVCSQNAVSSVPSSSGLVFDHSKMVAGHLGGGTHHAFHDYGEGYCVFNDLATAAALALKEFPLAVRRVLIVDLDVHQGNGTASIVNKLGLGDRVWTFSMHCKENYFSRVEHSTVDVEVPKGCKDEAYLGKLEKWLTWLFAQHRPDLVLYQSGVDSHSDDRLGHCSLTSEGLSRRNALLFDAIKAYNIEALARWAGGEGSRDYCRLVVTMGGGYPSSVDPESTSFSRVVELHGNVYTEAFYKFR
jgi:acetoin utilization deacetylase AcuC-like enzyme